MEEIATRLNDILAPGSPLGAGDIADDTPLGDLGMFSLQIQIAAAQVEAAFGIRFRDGELGQLHRFGDLVASIARHRGQALPT